MSDSEKKRRKVASMVFCQAWKCRRRATCLSMSMSLCLTWRTVRGKVWMKYGKVHGVTFEGRQAILRNLLKVPESEVQLYFEHEPGNPYDGNAVGIHAVALGQSFHVGYLAKGTAERAAPLLQQGYTCVVFFDGIVGQDRRGGTLGLNFRYALFEKSHEKRKAAA